MGADRFLRRTEGLKRLNGGRRLPSLTVRKIVCRATRASTCRRGGTNLRRATRDVGNRRHEPCATSTPLGVHRKLHRIGSAAAGGAGNRGKTPCLVIGANTLERIRRTTNRGGMWRNTHKQPRNWGEDRKETKQRGGRARGENPNEKGKDEAFRTLYPHPAATSLEGVRRQPGRSGVQNRRQKHSGRKGGREGRREG